MANNISYLYDVYSKIAYAFGITANPTYYGPPADILTKIHWDELGFQVIDYPQVFIPTQPLLNKTYEVRVVWTVYVYGYAEKQTDTFGPTIIHHSGVFQKYMEMIVNFAQAMENDYQNKVVIDTMGDNSGTFFQEHGNLRFCGGRFQFQTKFWTSCDNLEPDPPPAEEE